MSNPRLLLPDVDVAASSDDSATASASPRDSPGEIRPLTGFRGVAALYVVSYHHRLGVPFSNPLTTFLAHGYLAVDLFFVLSGFVMALTYLQPYVFPRLVDGGVRSISRAPRRAHLSALFRGNARGLRVHPRRRARGAALSAARHGAYAEPAVDPGLGLCRQPRRTSLVDQRGIRSLFALSAAAGADNLSPADLRLDRRTRQRRIHRAAVRASPSLAHFTHPAKLLDLYDSHLAFPVLRCLPEFVLGLLAYRVIGTPFGRALSTSAWAAPAICALTLVLMAIPKTDFLVALLLPLVVIGVASENHLPGKRLASPAGELTGTLSYSIYLTHELIVGLFRWLFNLGHAAWLVRAEAWAPAISVLFVFPVPRVSHDRGARPSLPPRVLRSGKRRIAQAA
jgi:peptidoglycan/LPS O-acetylase OafA/YrhL